VASGRGVPKALRWSGKTDYFSRQMGDLLAESGSYAGKFASRERVLAIFGAKFAADRPYEVPITKQGLPLDGAAVRCAQSVKFAHRATFKPLSPLCASAAGTAARYDKLKLMFFAFNGLALCRANPLCGFASSVSHCRVAGVCPVERGIMLLPKRYQFKIGDSCRVLGLCSPLGVLGYKPWPPGGHRNCAGVANRA
jgi:hypothetical protein